jgi:hypothetical protein
MCAASETGTDSACATSESDSDHMSTHSRSRPSARARARLLRRQQEQRQQVQDEEQEGHEHLQGGSAGHADLQWQQWQWQWQAMGTHAPGQPLPFLHEYQEQQEEHFRSSLWNGGWVMAPIALAAPIVASRSPPPPQHTYDPRRPSAASTQPRRLRHARDQPPRVRAPPSEATFQQQLWSGGWQMVPLQEEQPSSATSPQPSQPPLEEEQGAQGKQVNQRAQGVPAQRVEQGQPPPPPPPPPPPSLHEKQPHDSDQGAADGGAHDADGCEEAPRAKSKAAQVELVVAEEEEEAPRGREMVEGGSEAPAEAWSEA